jgi:hypothetical protein
MQDALLDQRALATVGATTVDQVKTALLERDEALATANDDLPKTRTALGEVQTVGGEGGHPRHGADPAPTRPYHPRGGTVLAGSK